MSIYENTFDFDDLDTEQLVSFEGYDYRLSSGTSGLQLNIKECPNCHNENWKVYLNADTGLGNCFVCDQKYSKFSFIKIARGFPHNADVFKYVKSYGDSLTYRPKVKNKPVFTPMNKDWKFPINEKIVKDDQIGEYLKNRNIDLKIAERFDLRRCDYGLYDFINLNGKKQYVDFSKRIIIPIRDIEGNIVTFQGRDITGNAERKYLFPNMLPATGAFIYNADYALKNNYKKIVLGEGVFDVYAITQALESDVTMNDYCACGTFGKHLSIANNKTVTVDQLRDLFRLRENGLDEIVMLWDGEPKAIAKAMETAKRLQNLGFDNVKVGVLPAGCDPGETSKEEVLKAIKEAKKVSPISLLRYRLSNVS